MYLPTGTPHAARAQERRRCTSRSASTSSPGATWCARRQPLLGEAADDHLPPATSTTPSRSPTGSPSGWRLADAYAGSTPTAVDAEVRRFLTGRARRLRGGLRDVLAARASTRTRLCAAGPVIPACCCRRGDRLDVLLGDRTLDVPPGSAGARASPRPARAPAGRPRRLLDPQSRLVLCRRLVREGLLEVA